LVSASRRTPGGVRFYVRAPGAGLVSGDVLQGADSSVQTSPAGIGLYERARRTELVPTDDVPPRSWCQQTDPQAYPAQRKVASRRSVGLVRTETLFSQQTKDRNGQCQNTLYTIGPETTGPLGGDDVRESIGERIRSVRSAQGIQRAELAKVAGCTPQYLAEIEGGNKEPSLGLLRRLALGLRVTAGDLLDGVDADREDHLAAYLSSKGDWSKDEARAIRSDIETILRLHHARKAERTTGG